MYIYIEVRYSNIVPYLNRLAYLPLCYQPLISLFHFNDFLGDQLSEDLLNLSSQNF